MNIKQSVEEVVDYIESNINQPMSLDILSRDIGYSRFYLHRIFQIYTGLSLMTYVKRRKLYHARTQLKTDKRILDIALDMGFASERSFSRAFSKRYGKSPGELRCVDFEPEEKMKVYNLKLPGKEWIDMLKDYLSDVKYVTLEEMKVISGIRQGMEPEEDIISTMMTFANDHKINFKRTFGFDSPVDESLAEKGGRGYEFWLAVDEDVKEVVDKSEFDLKLIPSYKYVTLRITEPFEDPMVKIPNAWKSLVAWLEENVEETLRGGTCLDCLEEVLEIDGKTYMDIFIPIAKG